MTPKNYYYNYFREDFLKFWIKAPNRPNYVSGEPLFKFAGLVKRDNFEPLEDISRENLVCFLSALGCTILIDQAIHAHFKEDYPKFQEMTLYPKMEVGWMNANPWMVFHQNVRLPRGLYKGEIIEKFTEFANFFTQDVKEFFTTNNFKQAKWEAVREAMLNDSDVSSGEFGEIFIKELKNDSLVNKKLEKSYTIQNSNQ